MKEYPGERPYKNPGHNTDQRIPIRIEFEKRIKHADNSITVRRANQEKNTPPRVSKDCKAISPPSADETRGGV